MLNRNRLAILQFPVVTLGIIYTLYPYTHIMDIYILKAFVKGINQCHKRMNISLL